MSAKQHQPVESTCVVIDDNDSSVSVYGYILLTQPVIIDLSGYHSVHRSPIA